MLNNHRPISSYQRNLNTDNQNKNNLNNNLNNENEINSNYINNNNRNSCRTYSGKSNLNNNNYKNSVSIDKNYNLNNNNTSSPKNNNLNHNEILERFNSFIKKFKVKKEDFIESEEIFLSFDDFNELFRKLKFDIRKDEVHHLFHFNNQYAQNDFIRIKNFLDLYKFDFQNLKTESLDSEKVDMQKINEEFKNFHGEILDIIRNDMIVSVDKEIDCFFPNKNFKNKRLHNKNINYNFNINNLLKTNYSNRPVTAMHSEKRNNIVDGNFDNLNRKNENKSIHNINKSKNIINSNDKSERGVKVKWTKKI